MRVYADNAATTAPSQIAIDAMMPCLTKVYGNPSSLHTLGQEAKEALDAARATVAQCLGCEPREIIFTSGGSEADNQAIISAARYGEKKGKKHIITTAFEHHAVLHTLAKLEKEGFEVTYLDVRKGHNVTAQQVKDAIRPDTCLVTTMYANNEIGSVLPIREIGAVCKEAGVPFHTDAVQAMGAMRINVADLGVDFMSFSAHKFNGPKGIGALYIKTGARIGRLISGGHQERTRRGGTTNVPGAVGFAEALRLTYETLEEDAKYVTSLRDRFIKRVTEEIPYVKLNGPKDGSKRLPNNADFSFEYIEGESILFSLDLAGIAVSSGSACSSGSLEPSHVLLALGVPEELAHGSIRFTFGKENTVEEVDYTVDKLKEIVDRLRKMSPLFKLDGTLKEV